MKAVLMLLPFLSIAAAAAPFAQTRVSIPDFDQVVPQDAFARVAEAGGVALVLENCPAGPALVSARGVSGRLPVVLDRLTDALGCAWSERDGVVSIRHADTSLAALQPRQPDTASVTQPASGGGMATGAPSSPVMAPGLTAVVPTLLKLAYGDHLAYALRDFLRGHGMALVWGAGDAGGVTTVTGEYTGDNPLAAVDAVLRAHGLYGIYARSNKTLYVR